MPIRFRCESCESRIKVPDGAEGRRVRCPRCGHLQRVPESTAASKAAEPSDFDLAETPPNAPPALEEEAPAPPPPPPPEEALPEPGDLEGLEDASEPEVAGESSEEPESEEAPEAVDEDLDSTEADDAPQAEDAGERPAAEELALDDEDPDAAGTPSDSLFERAQAESRDVPDRLEEGVAISARDVVGRGGEPAENHRPEPPSQLMATAAPKPAPRPRETPKPPTSIPLSGPASPPPPPGTADDDDAASTGPDPEQPQETSRPAAGIRLAPRHPSMPPPPPPAHQPPPMTHHGEGKPLSFLPAVLRVIAMLLVVAGIVHVVQVLGTGTRIAVLFNAAVVWIAAAAVTWTVGEIAAAVYRHRR